MLSGLQKDDRVRLRQAAYKVTDKYKHRRQVLRCLRKGKKQGKSYIPGAFTTKSVPDVDFVTEKDIAVTFVHDDDVPFVTVENDL